MSEPNEFVQERVGDVNGVVVTERAPNLSPERILHVAIQALSMRAARWLTLVLSFALFGFCALEPSWIRLATAASFTAMVTLVIWLRKESRHG